MAKKKLKIFTINWNEGGFGGGMCLIAAADPEAAREIAKEEGWQFIDEWTTEIVGASYSGDPGMLSSSKYQE